MMTIKTTKTRIRELRNKIYRDSQYPCMNEKKILVCKKELEKLEPELEKMCNNRCLSCQGSGRKWLLFKCKKCWGDGHLLYVNESLKTHIAQTINK